MSEIVNQSIQEIAKAFVIEKINQCNQCNLWLKNAYAIAKGTGIIFTGTIIGMLLGFVSRVIIVRWKHNTNRIRHLFLSVGFDEHICYNLHAWTTGRVYEIHRLF